MNDPLENGLFGIRDNDELEDEIFPPLPPPSSPGQLGYGEALADGEEEAGTQSKEPVVLRKHVKKPQPKLDAQRLTSDRGLPALRNLFDSVQFKGKGHESEDVKTLLWHMEHWAHRLYPKLQFEQFIGKVETLGNKKEVQTCLKKIRLDIPITNEDFTSNEVLESEDRVQTDDFETSFEAMPSQPVSKSTPGSNALSEEQQLQIERNKQLALERRQARLQLTNQTPSNDQGDSQCPSQSMEPNKKMVLDPDMFEDENVKSKASEEVTKTALSEPLGEFQIPTEISPAVKIQKDLTVIDKAIDSFESTDNSETTESH